MAQPCKTCRHASRSAIERELLAQAALDMLELKYHISARSLRRHRDNCIDNKSSTKPDTENLEQTFEQFKAEHPLEDGKAILEFARFQVWILHREVEKAVRDGNYRAAVSGVSAIMKTLTELFAKHYGVVDDTVRIDQSTKVIQVLGSFSDEQLRAYILGGSSRLALAADTLDKEIS